MVVENARADCRREEAATAAVRVEAKESRDAAASGAFVLLLLLMPLVELRSKFRAANEDIAVLVIRCFYSSRMILLVSGEEEKM